MDIWTIIVTISSGILGAILGILLSPYINYKYNIKLLQKQLFLRGKIKEYEKINEKINQLYENYSRFPEQEADEIKRRLEANKTVLEHFMKFTPPNKFYTSIKVILLIEDYIKSISKYCKEKQISPPKIFELMKKFNKYTNLIKKEIAQELGITKYN